MDTQTSTYYGEIDADTTPADTTTIIKAVIEETAVNAEKGAGYPVILLRADLHSKVVSVYAVPEGHHARSGEETWEWEMADEAYEPTIHDRDQAATVATAWAEEYISTRI